MKLSKDHAEFALFVLPIAAMLGFMFHDFAQDAARKAEQARFEAHVAEVIRFANSLK